jgi:hypothetical protein
MRGWWTKISFSILEVQNSFIPFFALKQVIKVNKEIDDRGLDQQMNNWLIPGNI